MFLNCGVGEHSWDSLGLQGGPTSQSYRKSILKIHWKNWCWSWCSNILATWCEEPTHQKRSWCWERLKTLQSPLDNKEIKPVNLKGNQSWIIIGRTNAEAEAPILRPPDAKIWLVGKDPNARKDWRQEEKGTTENEMVGCHHWLSGHEFEQTLGDGKGHGSLACFSPWGHKQSDMTEQLNNNSTLYKIMN